MSLSTEIQYFILFTVLLILPKALLRYKIPSALTALALGFATTVALGWFQDDQLLLMLSRLGITSLFLFAGMEVELEELRDDAKVLLSHVAKVVALIFIIAYVTHRITDISYRPALVLALGLMTPSTGFILNSLKSLDISQEQERWIRSKAIAKELVAIALLFFVLQTESIEGFAISTSSLIAMILLLPVAFRFFLKIIAPFAPDSEVTFLVLIALLCGVITTKLGTYYLVGAFIVGMTAARFRHFIENENSHKMLYSVSFFFSFFVPFYFYKAGLTFPAEILTWKGFSIGVLFLAVILPLRYFSITSSIWLFLRESWKDKVSIAIPQLPTLIFGLVIATILREKFSVPEYLVSGLIIYTIGSSVVPWFFLRSLPPESYDTSLVQK